MKYAHYNEQTNQLKGWYDDALHSDIPTPNIEVTDEVWESALSVNANFVDVDNKNVIYKDLRSTEELLKDAKSLKKLEFKESKFLVIDSKTFSTSRSDIQKYKEATDIRENANEATVNFQVLEGKIELSIIDARSIIKTLSEKAYNDFWVQRDFENDVDACTTIMDVEAIAVPTI